MISWITAELFNNISQGGEKYQRKHIPEDGFARTYCKDRSLGGIEQQTMRRTYFFHGSTIKKGLTSIRCR
jgi:hypothetical protein